MTQAGGGTMALIPGHHLRKQVSSWGIDYGTPGQLLRSSGSSPTGSCHLLPAARLRCCPPLGQPPLSLGPSAGAVGGSPEKKLTASQQLKTVFTECGAVGDSLHVGISSVSLGISYLAASSGVDVTEVLFKLGCSESITESARAAGTSTFLLAYALHKLFAPVQISITIVSVPFIVQYCWKIGFFKPPTLNP
uniref:DUF1279 domain-containing protein n=1 Tax=Cairina moschata TaxID=8855 RepID=A0A8C3BBY5_CAIMO